MIFINYELFSNIVVLMIIISIIPIFTLIFFSSIMFHLFGEKLDKYTKFVVKPYWFSYVISIVLMLICILTGNGITELTNFISSESSAFKITTGWIIHVIIQTPLITYAIWSFIMATFFMYIESTRLNRNADIIKMRKRKKEKLDKFSSVPLNYEKNVFICGKNGSGKTVAILNFIQEHIKTGEFCVIMDGKGDIGQYSLYDVVTKLSIKYNRKIYIINQTNISETHSYNPFIGCNATQVKDMLIAMSEWSEEHYKAKAEEYYQAVADFMIKLHIDISFKKFAKVASSFEFLLKNYKERINQEDFKYYMDVIARCYQDVQGSISRFLTIAHGMGSQLFDDDRNTFNIKKAREEKAIVLVMLNGLEYSDFARGVGKLVLNDIKNTLGDITKIKGNHDKFLCVYDEMSVYFCDMIVDIVNKARSLGGTNILATQTISDIDKIDENVRRSVIGNMHGFVLLKQADDKSAESLSKAIGTKYGTELTSKMDSFGKTGDGTSKIIDQFKVHPNDLKELPLGVAYWVDTMVENYMPLRVRFPYVEVNDQEYAFKDI